MKMKMKMTIRKRTKIDGISGIATSVKILADVKIGDAEVQVELSVPEAEYDTFKPGSQWESELVTPVNTA
jgi:hypothetical protein